MSGGYIEDYTSIYGCYNCSEIMGEVEVDHNNTNICKECGEPTIVSFLGSLYNINDMVRGGVLVVDTEDESTDVVELDFEDIIDEE